jgi:site-specific recombinase XerD
MFPIAWAPSITTWAAEQRAAGKATSTITLWRRYLKRIAERHPDGPATIQRGDLITWLAGPGWSTSTRRTGRSAARSYFTWAEDTQTLTCNPAARLPTVKSKRGVPRPAPDDVIIEALGAATDRVWGMLMAAAGCGMRRCEVSRMHTNDMIADDIRVVGKGGHTRVIPVPRTLAVWIRARPDGWVFPGTYNGHLSPPYVGKLMSRALPGRWTAHSLRHAYASSLADQGLDLHEIRVLMGHASVATTEIYTVVRRPRLVAAANSAALRLTRVQPPRPPGA